MKKYSYGLKKLKIIEQIAIVFFIAVVIPMSISGLIINNINQKSVTILFHNYSCANGVSLYPTLVTVCKYFGSFAFISILFRNPPT